MEKEGLLVLQGGFMKDSYKMSRHKAMEDCITKQWGINMKGCGQGTLQTGMDMSNGKKMI